MALRYFEEAIGGSDYYHVAESYFLLGVIHQKNGDQELLKGLPECR